MIRNPKKFLLNSLLAVSVTLAMTSAAFAQDRRYQRSQSPAVSLEINFDSSPRWVDVPGTRVREIRQSDRSDYDVFRYGRDYYAYNHDNSRWYKSRRWRGQFTLISDRSVPRQLRRVPRNHWRNYPAAWEDRSYQERYRRSDATGASLQITFGSSPRWMGIDGTGIEVVNASDRSNYDVFRHEGRYYAYDNNRWYTSPRASGEFTVIDERQVPVEMSRVPREHWRNYPSAWSDQNGHNGRGQGRGRGNN